MKLNTYSIQSIIKLTLVGLILAFTVSACKKSHSDIGAVVFKETRNKIFKDIETDAFVAKFKEVFNKQQKNYRNPKFLRAFYESNDFEPVLLMKNLGKDKLKESVVVLNNSMQHGMDPATFKTEQLNDLIDKVYNKKQIKTLEEAYQVLIDLELSAANSLSNYSDALQFGIISPRKIYAQYYTATKRPDSASFLQVFQAADITKYLDSIQPKEKQYLALQKALKENIIAPGISHDSLVPSSWISSSSLTGLKMK